MIQVGSSVRLSKTVWPNLHKQHGFIIGRVLRIYGKLAVVRWNFGVTSRNRISTLIEVEPFPFLSHRTMAQVIADEQRPEPA